MNTLRTLLGTTSACLPWKSLCGGLGFTSLLSLLPAQVAPSSQEPVSVKEDVIQLDPFSVAGDPTGYQVSTSTSGTRLNTALKDVPQSLTIITKDFLDDTFSTSLEDAVTFVPNVQPRQNVTDGLLIRGIQTTRKYYNNYLVPGFVAGLANVARIEILKGPASAIYGRGELGGIINYIPLRPLAKQSTTLRVTGGTYDHFETKLDVTGPTRLLRGLDYRVTANYLDSGSVVDFLETRQRSVNPSLSYKLGENTEFSYDGIFFRGRTPANEGTPFLTSKFAGAPANMPEVFAPRSLNTSGSLGNDWDQRDHTVDMHFFSATTTLWDKLYFRLGIASYDREQDQKKMAIANLMVRNAATGEIILNRAANHTLQRTEGLVAQGDIALKLQVFQRNRWLASSHETLVGYEYSDEDINNQRWPGTVGSLSVFNPDYNQTVTERSTRDQWTSNNRKAWGYFFHHVSKFAQDRLQLSVSWRWDDEEAQSNNLLTNRASQNTPDSTDAPRYGMALRIVPKITLYALRSEQSDPRKTTRTWEGLPGTHPNFDDRFSSQVIGRIDEIGLKTELFQSRLSLIFSYFEMVRDGVIQGRNLTPEEYAFLGIPLGAAGYRHNVLLTGDTSKGFELEWFGQITSSLSIYGGYGELDTSALASGVLGPTRGVPDYKLSSFLKSTYSLGRRQGLDGRIGVVVIGPQYANTSTELGGRHPASTRVDAGVTYRYGRYSFGMQVKNVTNVTQVISAVAPGSNTLAVPRSLLFNFSTRW